MRWNAVDDGIPLEFARQVEFRRWGGMLARFRWKPHAVECHPHFQTDLYLGRS